MAFTSQFGLTKGRSLHPQCLLSSQAIGLLAALLALPGVSAQTIVWSNPGVGNYSDGANWVGGAVPEGFNDIEITNGGTAEVSGTTPVSNVTLDGSSTIAVLPGILTDFNPNEMYVGVDGTGTLNMGSQSMVTPGDVYLGMNATATGVLTADGAYFSPYSFYVGYGGNATVTATNGSTIASTNGRVGTLSGSFGVVNLTASTWTVSEESQPRNLTVGESGQGQIHASNSQISAFDLTVGANAGSSGIVTLSGGNLTIEDVIIVGNASTGTLSLSNSAGLSSDGLIVGALAGSTGTLTADNADIHSTALFLARNPGSTGSGTISGGVTTLTGDIHVGSGGCATFALEDHAILHTDIGNVAFEAGSMGAMTVTDSLWNNARGVFVGVSGNGTLNIGPGGSIVSESGFIGREEIGVGAVNMNGGSWSMNNTLAVGVNGTATFSATGGSELSTVFSQIGLNEDSYGEVQMDGSTWTASDTLAIGVGGGGQFSVGNGSSVVAGSIELAASGGVTGYLSVVDSMVETQNILLGGGSGTLEFSGATIKLLGGSSVLDTLLISGFSPGDVEVQSGGLTVDTHGGNAWINSEMTGTGALTKTGAGRLRLTTANSYEGGTHINGGAIEITSNSSLGEGEVMLGAGELRAFLSSTVAGDLSGGIQLVSVSANQTGTFSAVANQTLTLAPMDFLLVEGSTMQVGSAGNTGEVVFAPTGAVALTATSNLVVAAGTLTAANEQLAFITSIAASTTVQAGATLDFNDQLAGGSISALFGAGVVQIGSLSNSTLTVGSGSFDGNISGNGALVKEGSGTLTLSGQNAFIGGTTVNAGTLIVNGDLAFGLGQVTVNDGATLGGSGIMGTIFLEGGTVAPGNSSGNLTAENLHWYNGTLAFELGATQMDSDLLILGGLEGFASTYAFTFLDNGWVAGTTYDLIQFELSDIAIGNFTFTNTGGFDGVFAYSNDTLQFTLNVIPEPGTAGLLALAALALLARTRSRR
jgi:fibronectin-binding autotransporter adhesin